MSTPAASAHKLYIHAARTYAAALAKSDPLREAEAWAWLSFVVRSGNECRISSNGVGLEAVMVEMLGDGGTFIGRGRTVRLAVEDLQYNMGGWEDWECPVEELLS